MTEAELATIEARDRARTPGEWEVWKEHVEVFAGVWPARNTPQAITGFRVCACDDDDGWCDDNDEMVPIDPVANAAFIAACSVDVPALCAALRAAWAEVERLRARNAILEDRLEEWSR